jgi:hypothetical protein
MSERNALTTITLEGENDATYPIRVVTMYDTNKVVVNGADLMNVRPGSGDQRKFGIAREFSRRGFKQTNFTYFKQNTDFGKKTDPWLSLESAVVYVSNLKLDKEKRAEHARKLQAALVNRGLEHNENEGDSSNSDHDDVETNRIVGPSGEQGRGISLGSRDISKPELHNRTVKSWDAIRRIHAPAAETGAPNSQLSQPTQPGEFDFPTTGTGQFRCSTFRFIARLLTFHASLRVSCGGNFEHPQ